MLRWLVPAGTSSTPRPVPMLGSSPEATYSAALRRPFALALLADGLERHGRALNAHHTRRVAPARVTTHAGTTPKGRAATADAAAPAATRGSAVTRRGRRPPALTAGGALVPA